MPVLDSANLGEDILDVLSNAARKIVPKKYTREPWNEIAPFQHRITRHGGVMTKPGIAMVPEETVTGQYAYKDMSPEAIIAEALSRGNLSKSQRSAFKQLLDEWKKDPTVAKQKGVLSVTKTPPKEDPSPWNSTVGHEAAHALYLEALKPIITEAYDKNAKKAAPPFDKDVPQTPRSLLLNKTPEAIRTILGQNPIYQRFPETTDTEAISWSLGHPENKPLMTELERLLNGARPPELELLKKLDAFEKKHGYLLRKRAE